MASRRAHSESNGQNVSRHVAENLRDADKESQRARERERAGRRAGERSTSESLWEYCTVISRTAAPATVIEPIRHQRENEREQRRSNNERN